jgi:hypothetical protein
VAMAILWTVVVAAIGQADEGASPWKVPSLASPERPKPIPDGFRRLPLGRTAPDVEALPGNPDELPPALPRREEREDERHAPR